MQFIGSYVAIITPFNSKGNLDRKTLERLVEWHVHEGTDGIVCCGSTGEGVVLSDREKKRVAEICIQAAGKRIPVLLATGTADTRQTVRLTESAQKLDADGCLVVTPYYNKPSQKGCILHFKEIAKVGLPIIVYHNPGRTLVRLTVETVHALSQIPHIAALKDSGHDLEWVRKANRFLPIIAGDDDVTYDILREGGIGAISVIGNLIPRGWKAMIRQCLEKKWDSAKRLAQLYMPLCRALFIESNPQCLKAAMKWLKLNNGILRLPLIEPSEKVQYEIKKELIRLILPFSTSPKNLKVSAKT